MSCCTATEFTFASSPDLANEEVRLASRIVGDGVRQTDLSIPGIHCGACIDKVETVLGTLPGVENARVNLSTKRVTIRWRSDKSPAPFIKTLDEIGYSAHLHDAGSEETDETLTGLIRALAVAGFASSNIMLLSVSVWSGADISTRNMFHWISALIAFPALVYSGRVFFLSAWRALRHFQTNMDVPISIGVLLASCMSLYEAFNHESHVYFDAAISLLFFLLIGRTLDHMMRERARTAVRGLARLSSRGALVVQDDGTHAYLPVNEIQPGMRILLAAGERVPVDARVETGQSEIDCALVSGENLPQPVSPGVMLTAGTLNLTAPITIIATAFAKDSFLAEMVRMMEAAEAGRSVYQRIADRASRLYAPVVHLTALLTFIGWLFVDGDLHRAATIATAVLIITCPCALGLAVPMVQIVAARRLFESGVMIKDGGALERIAEVDTVIFDKSGTLTLDRFHLCNQEDIEPSVLRIAASIAVHSRHPYSRALTAAGREAALAPIPLDEISEHPGAGMEAAIGMTVYKLGRPKWVLGDVAEEIATVDVLLSENSRPRGAFRFNSDLRPDVREAVLAISDQGCRVEIMSGDREEAVRRLASKLCLPYRAAFSPNDKTNRIIDLTQNQHRVLMVGDGLNDTAALVTAHASMAPASAADVGRNAADVVFLHDSLLAVPYTIAIAREAQRLVRQNLILAVGYNAIAVPVAVLGHVTPLVAAVAMSTSSLLVIANALRLHGRRMGMEARVGASTIAPSASIGQMENSR